MTRVRVARPTRDLLAVERFYIHGLGLSELWRTHEHVPGEYDLLMVGPPDASWHFEFAIDPAHPVDPTPTAEDLFVVYLGEPIDDALVRRLVEAGGRRVPALNPYWDKFGVTIADPDGYRLVLCARIWSA
jgi:catechol 2,3-dioxygenase-like lactoylglutathione lyase family enzyme